MLIHAFRRTATTEVDLNPPALVFKPNEQGHVVCDLQDDDAARLLAIAPDAYRVYDPENVGISSPVLRHAAAPAPSAPASDAPSLDGAEKVEGLFGSSLLPSVISLTGNKTVTLGEVVTNAFNASGYTAEEWNAQQPAEREAKLAYSVESMTDAAEHAEAAAAEAAEAKRKEDEAEAARVLAEQQAQSQTASDQATGTGDTTETPPARNMRFVLKGADGVEHDLNAMTDTKLREFGKQYDVAMPKALKGDHLREAIAAALVPKA